MEMDDRAGKEESGSKTMQRIGRAGGGRSRGRCSRCSRFMHAGHKSGPGCQSVSTEKVG